MDLDDKQLVERAQKGDGRAFEALVRKYQRRVFRLAFGMVKNQEDAMDVSQEAFVRVHKHLATFKGEASFYTWVYRITKNLCIDHLRRSRGDKVEYDDTLARDEGAGVALGLQGQSGSLNPAKEALRGELGGKISEALAELSENHREILLLRELEGLAYEELAETLEIKKGTVMSRLFHARKKMQEILKGYLTQGELRALLPEESAKKGTG